MRRTGLLAMTIAALAIVGAGAAAAQVYPPTADCGVQLSASAVGAGGAITISGTNAPPGASFPILFESSPVVIATATADASGNFVVQTTIPADAAPGRHTIRAQGLSGCAAEVFVSDGAGAAGPARARASGSLAFTGWNAVTILVIGLVSLTVGVLLVTAKRRRASVLLPAPARTSLVWRPRD